MVSAASGRAAQLKAVAPRELLSQTVILQIESAARSALDEPVARGILKDYQLVKAAASSSKPHQTNGSVGLALVEGNGEMLHPVLLLDPRQEAKGGAMPEKSSPIGPHRQERSAVLPTNERIQRDLPKFTGQCWRGMVWYCQQTQPFAGDSFSGSEV